MESQPQQPPQEESIWDLIRFALVVFVIAMGIRFFIAQPFIVSGSSMVPTFNDKNYLIVDELSYRFHTPNRGDVVIFHPPGQPRGIYYIKRVIGLPGETVKIANETVTIINTEHPEGFVLDEPYISAPTNGTNTTTVTEDTYFVLGDNRPYSSDSRTWGVLPRENIIGRAFIRLFPLKSISTLPGAYHAYEAK